MDAIRTRHHAPTVMPKALRATVICFACCIIVLALTLFQVSRTGQITASTANQTARTLLITQQQLQSAVTTVNALAKAVSADKESLKLLTDEILRLRALIVALGGDPGPLPPGFPVK